MTTFTYKSIAGKAPDIIEEIMALPIVCELPSLEFTLRLALEELVVNVVNYAYGEGGDGPLEVSVERREDSIVMTFADEGVAFNPLERETPDITLPLDERPIGGLGIFLVRELMDDVVYHREGQRNILTIKKLVPSE